MDELPRFLDKGLNLISFDYRRLLWIERPRLDREPVAAPGCWSSTLSVHADAAAEMPRPGSEEVRSGTPFLSVLRSHSARQLQQSAIGISSNYAVAGTTCAIFLLRQPTSIAGTAKSAANVPAAIPPAAASPIAPNIDVVLVPIASGMGLSKMLSATSTIVPPPSSAERST
jgi:hypothetical protein